MRVTRLVYFLCDKKILILGVLLLYICYEIATSQECNNTWVSTAPLFKKESSYNKYKYTVLIASAPYNHARRASIRQSWMKLAAVTTGNEEKYPVLVKFFFVIGTGGLKELEKHQLENENIDQDMLLFDELIDSYKALTSKMLLSLKWINNNMKGLKYLIKCDDDSFLRIDGIVHNLEVYAPSMDAQELSKYISHQDFPHYKGIYWGYFNGRARVFKSGKWEERNWFLCDRYLPYALGGAYVISHNIVDYIARNAEVLSQYNSEDVSMGVWTSSLDGINRVHDLRFDTSATSRGCSNDMLVRHKVSASDMTEIYRTLVNSNGKKLCKDEGVNNHYVYNWTAVPSMCCKVK